MKQARSLASLVLALVLALGALATFAFAAETTPGYKLVNTYDADAGTVVASLYVTGGYGSVGQLGIVYDPSLLSLAATVQGTLTTDLAGAKLTDIAKSVDGTGDNAYSLTTTGETNKLSDLVNAEDGEFFFAWYTGLTMNVDACETDKEIVRVTFAVKSGKTKADLEKAGESLLGFAKDTPSDPDVVGYRSGVYLSNENNTAFRSGADAAHPVTAKVEFVGLAIEPTGKPVTFRVVDADGKPVAGAYVKIGDEEKQTNANGEATFSVSGSYAVQYKKSASDSYVTAPAGAEEGVIDVPAKPVRPTVKSGTLSLTVSWQAPESGGSDITGFKIVLTQGSKKTEYEAAPNAHSKTIAGLTGGATYQVQVCAINAVGEGELSDKASGVPAKESSGGGTGGGGGGGGAGGGGAAVPTQYYTVTYQIGSSGVLSAGSRTESVAAGKKPAGVPTVQALPGFTFTGWTLSGAPVDPSAVTITAATTFVAQFTAAENTHAAYVTGYEDGTVRPQANITRAEAVTLIARLSPDFVAGTAYPASFTDVEASAWYAPYVGFAVSKGYVNGYADGDGAYSFRPQANITRAEFAAIICRLLNLATNTQQTFTDVPNAGAHWAFGYISTLKANGIVAGYSDGSFLPQNSITRAEAITILNRANGRVPDDARVKTFTEQHGAPATDVAPSDWYYAQIAEAVMPHAVSAFHA